MRKPSAITMLNLTSIAAFAATLAIVASGCSMEPFGSTAKVTFKVNKDVSVAKQTQSILNTDPNCDPNTQACGNVPPGTCPPEFPNCGVDGNTFGTHAGDTFFQQHLPENASGFNCYALKVSGEGLFTAGEHGVVGEFAHEAHCTGPGTTSHMIEGGQASKIEMVIPSGPNRTVQVFGIVSSIGCPADKPFAEIMRLVAEHTQGTDPNDKPIKGVFEIGRLQTNIFEDQTIAIKSDYDKNKPKNMMYCHFGDKAFSGPATAGNTTGGPGPANLHFFEPKLIVNQYQSHAYVAMGGTPPYAFSAFVPPPTVPPADTGFIDPQTGLYTPPAVVTNPFPLNIKVIDADNQMAEFPITVAPQQGKLDMGWNAVGYKNDFTNSYSVIRNAVAYDNGSVITAGVQTPGDPGNVILRMYNADGSTDSIFDGNFTIDTDFKASPNDRLGLGLQSDGKIIVGAKSDTTKHFTIARYNPDGTVDATFAAGGKREKTFPTCADYQVNDLTILKDNNHIIAVGWAGGCGPNSHLIAVEYDDVGTILAEADLNVGAGAFKITKMQMLAGGKFIVVGEKGGDSFIARLKKINSTTIGWDTTFSTDGWDVQDFGAATPDFITSVDKTGNGDFITTVKKVTGGGVFFAKWFADGTYDNIYDLSTSTPGTGNKNAYDLMKLKDDSYVVVGTSFDGSYDFPWVIKVDSTGQYIANSAVTLDMTAFSDYVYGVATLPDGRAFTYGKGGSTTAALISRHW